MKVASIGHGVVSRPNPRRSELARRAARENGEREVIGLRRSSTVMAWMLALSLHPLAAFAQDPDPSKVEIKVEKAGGNVYMLTGVGGNIGVSVGPDGILIVDDQFASLAPKIQAALKGLSDQPVRFVLNTHWHFDHAGGNVPFAKAGSLLIAHDNVRKRLESGGYVKAVDRTFPPAPREALPVITFDQSLTVHVNGEDIRALHYTKGHTDGDTIIYFPKSKVLHMGDNFVTYGLPLVDVTSGGSVRGMVDTVERAVADAPDDVKIIPGHGPLCTKAEVKKFTEMLRECIALVEAARRQGKTLTQAKSENVLKKYDALGQGFVKTADFIALIWNELQGQPANTRQASQRHH
jgi:glyoxylase-like metal-dependent hydrolase (beta-lactamase superfamily II)